MFCLGTFHGDLHPGNVLLTGDRLCFIDTGYIGKMYLDGMVLWCKPEAVLMRDMRRFIHEFDRHL